MRRRRPIFMILLPMLLAGLSAPTAAQAAQTSSAVDRAVPSLRQDPVYVDPGARSALSDSQADELRGRIREAQAGPIYIAVFPEDVGGGGPTEIAEAIANRVGVEGTYAVVVGTELRAGNTGSLPQGSVPNAATEAVQAKGGQGVSAVLLELVDRVADIARGTRDRGGSSSGVGILPVLLVVGGGIFVVTRMRRRREQQEAAAQLEEVRQVALDDLVALGEDLRALDLDVEMPAADPDAKKDYVHALECYERASGHLDRARRPVDLQPVASALEEGRYAMACAKARLEGREPPERRPPCFFDPRHGPSAREVEWAPPGGRSRKVPACAADAQRVEQGEEPVAREIDVGGRSTPYWNAPPYYGPWAGGYLGGGLFEGLLIGSMLGGGHDDFDGDSGGGDFGGGDFGGGDFGGGDFGGGDFGGGG
jgi:hypothetical protein